MVKIPEVVGIETEIVDGKTVVKQMYADGSYGVDINGYTVEIHYPSKDVRVFEKKDDNDYYLSKEILADKTVRRYDSKENMVYEKLPKGEERTWKVVNGKRFLEKEIIPGEIERKYGVKGERTRLSRHGVGIIPGTEKHYLSSETFPNGLIREYSVKGDLVKETFPDKTWKQYSSNKKVTAECLADGTIMTYYGNGNVATYTSPDKQTERTWHYSGKLASEKLPGGVMRKWDSDGRITYEVRADKTVVDYKYDENGNLIYHAVNGKEDTVKYLAMKKVAERQSQKSEKLREQHVEYKDSNGNVRERQSVEKLKPLQKTVQMLKAMREVKKNLKR